MNTNIRAITLILQVVILGLLLAMMQSRRQADAIQHEFNRTQLEVNQTQDEFNRNVISKFSALPDPEEGK